MLATRLCQMSNKGRKTPNASSSVISRMDRSDNSNGLHVAVDVRTENEMNMTL